MSRMLSYLSPRPMSLVDAVGDDLLDAFVALSRLHADGWGTAWIDPAEGAVRVATGTGLLPGDATLPSSWLEPSAARMLYLRFASRGAPASAENAQPFLRGGLAFQHNGLLAPRADAVAVLRDPEGAALRGSTDSEVYFAVAREAGVGAGRADRDGDGDGAGRALATAAGRLRERFDSACLNALALSESALHVVHFPGTARVPLAAFAERGFAPADLPPGHDDTYNELRTAVTADGIRLVATTGIPRIPGIPWTPVPLDTVLSFPFPTSPLPTSPSPPT